LLKFVLGIFVLGRKELLIWWKIVAE